MNDKYLDIVINTDGTVEVDQLGWQGKNCEGAVDDLINMLGREIKKDHKKEWHKHQRTEVHQHRLD